MPHSRVLYFQSYLQASQLALQRRLISREGVERVKASVEGSNLVRLCRLHAQAGEQMQILSFQGALKMSRVPQP